MKKKPLISICIPAYNRLETLKEWLESIVKQFDGKIEEKIEIIIADDASPDIRIGSMVKEFIKKYPNIYYHRYPENMRLSSNLMHVTTFAKWEYLWLMADDDCMTDFALEYTVEIIEKTNTDLLLCNAVFWPDMTIPVVKKKNTFKELNGIDSFINYLFLNKNTYQDLVVYFQFYSILVVKHKYFKESLSLYDRKFIYDNIFPQDIVVYSHIKDKKIIIPDNVFVRGRTLNESYKASKKFITDFKVAMNIIEKKNNLWWSKQRKKLKKTVISWWRNTIILWKILRFLHIDYKKNKFFKRLYFFYKKHIQNRII